MHTYKRKLKPRIDTRRQQGLLPAVEDCANAFEPSRGRIMASASFSPEEIARLSREATPRIDYETNDAEHVDLDSRLAFSGNEIVRLKVDICHRIGKWENPVWQKPRIS